MYYTSVTFTVNEFRRSTRKALNMAKVQTIYIVRYDEVFKVELIKTKKGAK